MLKKIKIKIRVLLLFLIYFYSSNVLANNEYFKCPEKITKVLKGDPNNMLISEGSIIGTNYLNIKYNYISVKFKENFERNKNAIKIITNKRLNRNSLGYEVSEKYSDSNLTTENNYNFIKVGNTYAFVRMKYHWSLDTKSKTQKIYQYESSGRCMKIDEKEFELERVIKVAKKQDKKIIKKKIIEINPKLIEGERSFAMSWQDYDDLILGRIRFKEQNPIGMMEFSLPNNDGNCIGTYVLSKVRGTWSIYCQVRDLNASGYLVLNNKDGSISGNGQDNKGKKIKFKVETDN